MSNEIKTRCPAKVNLTFEILGTFSDGYHEVSTLLQTVSLEDELTFEFSESNAKHESHAGTISYDSYESEFSSEFPSNDSNLISKAIRKYQEVVPEARLLNASVRIKKNIPIGAGLAGGSANAAAALVAINRFLNDILTHNQLLEIGATLGADVPFSIEGGTCIGTNRGDVLQKLTETAKLVFLLVKPRSLDVSTPWAFNRFDEETAKSAMQHGTAYSTIMTSEGTRTSVTRLCSEAISRTVRSSHTPENLASRFSCESKPRTLARHLHNDFEKVIFSHYQDLQEVRQKMEDFGAIAARLTGSGPTLYAISESREHAEQIKDKLLKFQSEKNASETFPLNFWITESLSRGARVISE